MSDDRDPLLEQFFAEAEQELDDSAFVNNIVALARKQRRQRMLWLGAACLVIVPVVWLVATPLNELALSLMELIFRPVSDANAGFAAPILSPLNNFASLLVLGALALRAIYRWLTG